jgi:hypothetical protein
MGCCCTTGWGFEGIVLPLDGRVNELERRRGKPFDLSELETSGVTPVSMLESSDILLNPKLVFGLEGGGMLNFSNALDNVDSEDEALDIKLSVEAIAYNREDVLDTLEAGMEDE